MSSPFSSDFIKPDTTEFDAAMESIGAIGERASNPNLGRVSAPQMARRKRFDFARALGFFGGLGPNIIAAEQQQQAQQTKALQKLVDGTATDLGNIFKGFADRVNKISGTEQATAQTKIDLTSRLENLKKFGARITQELAMGFMRMGLSQDRAESMARSRFNAAVSQAEIAIQGYKTFSEVSAEKGKGKVAQSDATAQALGTSRKSAAQAQGLISKPNVKNFLTPGGERGMVDLNDPDAMARLPAGTQLFSIQAQPKSIEDFTHPGKKEVAEARGAVAASTATIRDLSTTLKKLEKAQGASGLRGTIAEVGGGLLSQLPVIGKETGEAFSNFIAGASQQEISSIRTRARFNVARMLRSVTGDESGRYTDTEREIADKTVKTLSPTSSFPQIRGALKTAMEIDIFARERAKVRIDPKLSRFVVTDDAKADLERGRGEVKRLMGLGFTAEEAADIVARLFEDLTDLAEQFRG